MMYLDERGRKKFDDLKIESLLKNQDILKVLPILKREKVSELVDYEGNTLLHLSAKYNNPVVISYLIRDKDLEVNFDVNAVNRSNETPLMILVHYNNDVNTLKLLLDAGADLWKIKNNTGRSALAMIILKYNFYNNNTSILELVMAELEKRCSNIVEMADVLYGAGCQPYHLKMYKKAEITKLLIERGCPVNLKNPEYKYNTALHVAAEMNDVDNVKVLLKFEADQYIKNEFQILPLEKVVENDSPDPEILSLLWPDDKDWLLKSINMACIFSPYCREETLQLIFKHCAVNLTTSDRNGFTPLHYLAQNRKISRDFWESIENAKMEVNAKCNSGLTPLFNAVRINNLEAVRFLLAKGADVNALSKHGRSPVFDINARLRKDGWHDCFKLLMEYGANLQLIASNRKSVLTRLIILRDFDALVCIIHHLALIEARDSRISTIVLSHIEADNFTKNCFKKCKRELDDMKTEKISGNVSYYNFLINKDQKIQRYVKNEEIVKVLSKCEGKSYFHQLLIERFEKALEVKRWRTTGAQLIKECIESLNGYDLIIEMILDFLEYSDWKLMASTD